MLEGVGAVHMPCWMQTPTTRWVRGCVSSFNNRSLWVGREIERMFVVKMGHPRPLSVCYRPFQANEIQLLQQINVKNVHLVIGAGIQTHNLMYLSLPP